MTSLTACTFQTHATRSFSYKHDSFTNTLNEGRSFIQKMRGAPCDPSSTQIWPKSARSQNNVDTRITQSVPSCKTTPKNTKRWSSNGSLLRSPPSTIATYIYCSTLPCSLQKIPIWVIARTANQITTSTDFRFRAPKGICLANPRITLCTTIQMSKEFTAISTTLLLSFTTLLLSFPFAPITRMILSISLSRLRCNKAWNSRATTAFGRRLWCSWSKIRN